MGKLVRDKVKDHLDQHEITLKYEDMPKRDAEKLLHGKLLEEATELLLTNDKEHALKELGDIQQVLWNLCYVWGWRPDEVHEEAQNKLNVRGGFSNLTVMSMEITEKQPSSRPCIDSHPAPYSCYSG